MSIIHSFQRYCLIVEKVDEAFAEMQKIHPDKVACEIRCADCCHAIFGVFLIEAAYLQRHFSLLDDEQKAAVLERAEQADKELQAIQQKLQPLANDQAALQEALSEQRVRCPLLSDDDTCTLYAHRPITCRLYGVPTGMQGTARVCEKARFSGSESYPVFDMDRANKALYLLTREMLSNSGQEDLQRAELLLSVGKAVSTSLEGLIHEKLE
jgi:Fe-S-cluster containining protein